MIDTLLSFIPSAKKRNVAYAAAGMLGVLAGQKITGLALFAKGLHGLEQEWRKAHPEFEGGVVARWDKAIEFYEATHENGVNRKLHIIGIPMIAGGAAGLLLFSPFRPFWFVSASSFTAGWILNFIGHAAFEKKAPAFADDPLSFLAGPVWDFKQLFGAKESVREQKARDDVFTQSGAQA